MKRHILVATVAVAAVGAFSTPTRGQEAPSSEGKGCFHVELSRDGSEAGDDAHLVKVPEVMEFILYSQFLQRRGGDGEDPRGVTPRAASFAVWQPVSPDTAMVVWSDDSRALHMRLGATEDALVGTAEMVWERGARRETLRATAAPVPCVGP